MIQVLDELVITRENIKLLKPYLKVDQNKIVLVDAPVHYVSGKVTFDETLVSMVTNRNLMVAGELTIHDASLLSVLGECKIDAKIIVCHRDDHDLVKSYCKKSDAKIQLIELKPFGNYSVMVINKDYLSTLKEVKVIENYGDLEFDVDINKMENEHLLLEIKNYGTIVIPEEIHKPIKKLITENYGIINNEGDIKKVEKDTAILYKNMGYLEL
jgi:hypothetical protein